MASHNNEFVSHYHKCTIKMTLTGRDFITLNKEEVEEHVLKHPFRREMVKGAITGKKLVIEDVDTGTDHVVDIYYYLGYVYIIHDLFRSNFIERRSLVAGDEIGFYWDHASAKLCFSVLMRNFF